MTSSANPDRASSLPDELVKINRFIAPPEHDRSQTKQAPKTSATQRPQRPLLAKTLRVKAYSSAGSSPSASRSAGPARICSAIRPEFWRIEVSILAVMSGLAFKNAFEFSRPWPRR